MATLRPYRPSGGLGIAPEPPGMTRPPAPLTLADKRALCEICATLDGKPATITGALERTALVVTFDGEKAREYSWFTVALFAARDIARHGHIRFGA